MGTALPERILSQPDAVDLLIRSSTALKSNDEISEKTKKIFGSSGIEVNKIPRIFQKNNCIIVILFKFSNLIFIKK